MYKKVFYKKDPRSGEISLLRLGGPLPFQNDPQLSLKTSENGLFPLDPIHL